ncbi:MAG: M56 family metallopeptidase [Bryobacterales bacterium]
MTAIDALGWTLLHFLWQGAAIAFLLAAANPALRETTARARYAAACGAMLLMLACAAGTFAWLYSEATPSGARFEPQATAAVAATGITKVFTSPEVASPPAARISSYLSLLVYFWFAGVCLLGIRSLGGWVVVQRLRRQASRPADDAGQQQLARLARRLGIARLVQLRESAAAQAPAVIGWLKPVVLLPVAALGGLSPQQLEALLAHELAHIRRHDYLVNLFQTAIETLLFYHPAVWWVGRRIRAERENCCDDLAVEVCGDALLYARGAGAAGTVPPRDAAVGHGVESRVPGASHSAAPDS